MNEGYVFGVAWQEIVDWFLVQPIFAQVLVLIGVFAVLTLAIILVYYVLKGVAYLVYYILKGVYYLLKGIGLLFYKIFEALYYAISGKPKPECCTPSTEQETAYKIKQEEEPIIPIQKTYQTIPNEVAYCSECGNRFTDSMLQTLSSKGTAYCIHCGKGFQANSMGIESE